MEVIVFVEHTLNYFCIFLNINKIDKCTNAGGTTMKNRQRIEREEPRWFPCHGSVGLGLHGAGWPMYRVTHRECQNYSFCWNWKHSWVYWMFRRLVYASSSSSSTPSGSSPSLCLTSTTLFYYVFPPPFFNVFPNIPPTTTTTTSSVCPLCPAACWSTYSFETDHQDWTFAISTRPPHHTQSQIGKLFPICVSQHRAKASSQNVWKPLSLARNWDSGWA